MGDVGERVALIVASRLTENSDLRLYTAYRDAVGDVPAIGYVVHTTTSRGHHSLVIGDFHHGNTELIGGVRFSTWPAFLAHPRYPAILWAHVRCIGLHPGENPTYRAILVSQEMDAVGIGKVLQRFPPETSVRIVLPEYAAHPLG
ncbi:MAG TPA: hypothetical protein VJK52_01270 [Candidatus Nanoarchaeia archaeon]|nr:hypothetical protein [Candidatus Nanoarchaeia archaeon]